MLEALHARAPEEGPIEMNVLAEEAGLLENVELMVLDKFVEEDTVIFISTMENLENM